MLRTAAEFPHPGSQAFLADSGEPARVVRHNPDQTTLISLQPTARDPLIGRIASGNRTVPTSSLRASLGEATGLDERGRPYRPRAPRQNGARPGKKSRRASS